MPAYQGLASGEAVARPRTPVQREPESAQNQQIVLEDRVAHRDENHPPGAGSRAPQVGSKTRPSGIEGVEAEIRRRASSRQCREATVLASSVETSRLRV